MSKINPENTAPVAEAVERSFLQAPVLYVGVSRKANIGNYETVDCYAGISLPMPEAIGVSPDRLREVVAEIAELGISLVASETAQRYTAIKNLMAGA